MKRFSFVGGKVAGANIKVKCKDYIFTGQSKQQFYSKTK
jgi:hypothetical protein